LELSVSSFSGYPFHGAPLSLFGLLLVWSSVGRLWTSDGQKLILNLGNVLGPV
jgi:hypothetical protein